MPRPPSRPPVAATAAAVLPSPPRQPIGDKGAQSLATSLLIDQSLRDPYLENNVLGDNGATSLANVRKSNGALEKLTLEKNPISNIAAMDHIDAALSDANRKHRCRTTPADFETLRRGQDAVAIGRPQNGTSIFVGRRPRVCYRSLTIVVGNRPFRRAIGTETSKLSGRDVSRGRDKSWNRHHSEKKFSEFSFPLEPMTFLSQHVVISRLPSTLSLFRQHLPGTLDGVLAGLEQPVRASACPFVHCLERYNYFRLVELSFLPSSNGINNSIEQNANFRLAIGSYIEQYNNTVQILKTNYQLQPNAEYPVSSLT